MILPSQSRADELLAAALAESEMLRQSDMGAVALLTGDEHVKALAAANAAHQARCDAARARYSGAIVVLPPPPPPPPPPPAPAPIAEADEHAAPTTDVDHDAHAAEIAELLARRDALDSQLSHLRAES